MKLDAKTIHEAVTQLSALWRHAPYRFGGKWFVAAINGEGRAYRAKADLLKAAAKAGSNSLEMAVIE